MKRPANPMPPLAAPPAPPPRILQADLGGTWRATDGAYEARVVIALGKLDHLVRRALASPRHEATAADGAVVVRVKPKKPAGAP